MTDKECIDKIEEIARSYVEDDDDNHWGDYFMEKIIDVLEEYNRKGVFGIK